MIKSIGYAYPTSAYAAKLGVPRSGCYYVELKQAETDSSGRLVGPYADLTSAEQFAEKVDASWSHYSMRSRA